jgi:hypothetical protein
MALSNKITMAQTIALVNVLARLHNFCLGTSILDQLDVDVSYILNEHDNGYVVMD